jgi:flagellar hook-length control protein FliK
LTVAPLDPIAVTAALLRAQLPDVPLREGATLMARVASRGESHAVIVLAGIPVTAQVPPEVQAGATLKLKVLQVTPERVTLQLDPATTPPPAVLNAPAPAHVPRPEVQVDESPARRRDADGEEVSTVSLAFTSPTLGRLDLRLELRGERLLAEVTTPAGPAHQIATAGIERLRAKLTEAGLEPTVRVRPRHTPLDVYA